MTAPDAAPGDQARVTVLIAVEPALAFELFTEEIDQWWRRGQRFRHAHGDQGLICIEPGVGGRVFESFGDGAGADTVVEIGSVLAWEPARRLLFEWRFGNFVAGERTEVEVLFEPSASGTRVTVTHRGWAGVRADHPARHGHDVPAFIRMIGLWWGDLMRSLSERAEVGKGRAN